MFFVNECDGDGIMRFAKLWLCTLILVSFSVATTAQTPKKRTAAPVVVGITSSMKSAKGQIRQFMFDGNAETYFASEQNPQKDDHLTLQFDELVNVKSINVMTGLPDGQDKLEEGTLEVSSDGRKFQTVSKFVNGVAELKKSQRIAGIRIKASGQDHPLIVREIEIASVVPLAQFRYPVEFIVDVSDAPEMKDWANNVARICERAYPMINDELKSEGFQPTHTITLTLKSSYDGVAATSGFDIVGSVKFFREHPDDIGAMVHETVHCVQRYQARNFPIWLQEGVADYVRFFKFEPGKLGRVDPNTARYNGSYRTSASFLAFVVAKYDAQAVLKINAALRDREVVYTDALFERLTGKTVQELEAEWRKALPR